SRNVRVLLHGHTHLTEDKSSFRPVSPGRAYPIPCPTLTSITTSGDRGLNLCILGSDGVDTRLTVLVWHISESTQFIKENLSVRYSLPLSGTQADVIHGRPAPPRRP